MARPASRGSDSLAAGGRLAELSSKTQRVRLVVGKVVAQPEIETCTSAPPNPGATTSPVAACTSGGRQGVPFPFDDHFVGHRCVYAPPAGMSRGRPRSA